MNRQVVFSTAAAKDYGNLDPQIKARIDKRLTILSNEPFTTQHSKPLVNQGGLRSSRVGDWRILYLPREAELHVIHIQHRREAYRNL